MSANLSQQQIAMLERLEASESRLVTLQAPPGSGVTSTLIHAARKQAASADVVVIAPSRAALANWSATLSQYGLKAAQLSRALELELMDDRASVDADVFLMTYAGLIDGRFERVVPSLGQPLIIANEAPVFGVVSNRLSHLLPHARRMIVTTEDSLDQLPEWLAQSEVIQFSPYGTELVDRLAASATIAVAIPRPSSSGVISRVAQVVGRANHDLAAFSVAELHELLLSSLDASTTARSRSETAVTAWTVLEELEELEVDLYLNSLVEVVEQLGSRRPLVVVGSASVANNEYLQQGLIQAGIEAVRFDRRSQETLTELWRTSPAAVVVSSPVALERVFENPQPVTLIYARPPRPERDREALRNLMASGKVAHVGVVTDPASPAPLAFLTA